LPNHPATIVTHKLTIKNKLIVGGSLTRKNLNNNIATPAQILHHLTQSSLLSRWGTNRWSRRCRQQTRHQLA
jgi:hypothetical protein